LISDKRTLFKFSLLIVANFGFISLQYLYSYRAIGIPLPLVKAWLLAVTSSLSIFFSLTPGNLGIQEAYVGFISSFVGLGFTQGMVVAALMRVATASVAFALGPYYSYYLLKKLETA